MYICLPHFFKPISMISPPHPPTNLQRTAQRVQDCMLMRKCFPPKKTTKKRPSRNQRGVLGNIKSLGLTQSQGKGFSMSLPTLDWSLGTSGGPLRSWGASGRAAPLSAWSPAHQANSTALKQLMLSGVGRGLETECSAGVFPIG